MDFQTFVTCLIAVTLLTLTPGIDTFLIIRNSVRGGRLDGAVSSFGICSGLLIHACISALGVSLILLHTAWAYSCLKTIGAGYLIWLGFTSIRKVFTQAGASALADAGHADFEVNLARSFREGFLSNILNPKAVVFYMAFLPQFINPEQNVFMQSMLVAGLHALVAMIWQCSLAVLVDKARTWITNRMVDRVLNGSLGCMMMLLGLRLLVDE